MVEVHLTQGKVALVDDEDAERVLAFKWTYYFSRLNGKSYARRAVWAKPPQKQGTIYLHRFIVSAPKGKQVDHRDNDGLNCQKINLRLADNIQNHQNMKMPNTNLCGFKGVSRDRRRAGRVWRARIVLNKRRHELGCFFSAEEAAQAYDAKARELFGEFARLNFPAEGEQPAIAEQEKENVSTRS